MRVAGKAKRIEDCTGYVQQHGVSGADTASRFAPSFFDDIFVHSRAEGNLSNVQVHLRHLKQVFQVMRDKKLYANLKKCVFCAPEIPVLGCYVNKSGV